MESFRETGVMVPSVWVRDAIDGFLAVVVVLAEPYEAMDPFRLELAGDVPDVK